ncbi:MAG: FAD-dependent oxidoreductase [Planctomycetes bacterium]|nr:FAD-dependent oxidoreductase [Planctomycetota bacterium]MBM4078405.1 FAD-dependent oxidoreductase [Planctomycetota bacterium]
MPKGYCIPYRSLIPQSVNDLLVAGRCMSVTWEGLGSPRVMAICMATGQAAGTAAALAVRAGVPPRALPIEELQERLRKDGAVLDL